MTNKSIKGFFIWSRGTKGEAIPSKVDADIRSGAQPNTIKDWEAVEMAIIPLHVDGWSMSLDALVLLYPCPKKE